VAWPRRAPGVPSRPTSRCSGRRFAPPLMLTVCAVHVVLLGGESPLSR
jgi:hypothetical protein